jgi:hypothetical protein
LKKNIVKESFTLTGASRYRSFILFVLSKLNFEFHSKAKAATKYIFYGKPHDVADKIEDYHNYKKGPGKVHINMEKLDLSRPNPF